MRRLQSALASRESGSQELEQTLQQKDEELRDLTEERDKASHMPWNFTGKVFVLILLFFLFAVLSPWFSQSVKERVDHCMVIGELIAKGLMTFECAV